MTTIKPKIKLSDFFAQIYRVKAGGIPEFKMFIDGQWVTSGDKQTFSVDSPIDDSVIAKAPQATMSDAENAVKVAYDNWQKIRDIPAIERIEIFENARQLLLKHKDEFVKTLMLEAGKTRRDAEGEVSATSDRLRMAMEDARKIFGEYIPGDWSEDTLGKIGLVIHEPVGIVAAISPFNYPLFISAAKIIPALLAGNAVVAKPPSDAPLSLLLFARVLEASKIPSGSFNVVTGGGVVGEALVKNEKVGMVSFTGSTDVGKHISSIAGVKKLHLELGGKGVAIVLEDADLNLAAERCVEGSLRNAGQRCDAISSVLAVQSIASELVEKIIDEIDKWKFGNPTDPSVMTGPVINQKAAVRIHGLVEDAVSKGAKLIRGGKYHGCYYEPTLLDQVPLEAKIAWEETFGPVITVIRVRGEDEAIEIANKPRYGLDSCVFTNSFYRMWKVAKKLRVGSVTINDLPRHGVGYFPFGGLKDSGIGREGVGYSIDEMTVLKTISFNLEPAKLGKRRRFPRM